MNKVILAIDDNRDFLETLKDILEHEGYRAVLLTDPTKTEEYIENYSPDLIILDIFMPKRTGFNILEDLSDNGMHEDIPKIFLTCLDNHIEKMTARARGACEYLTKPFEPEELIEVIRECLEGQKQR
ncbi:MAG: response regulator [Candidatus Omnitrophica bacterium]|nr:response regulator [Candidatus Omnitrophota bacterium]